MKYNLEGLRFGRLIVLERDDARPNTHDTYWRCKCDCGAEKSVTTGHLTAGTVQSCGCLRKEQSIEHFKKAAKGNVRHGEAGTPLYNIWHSMKQRCENRNSPAFKWYGAKGVKVCDEWKDYAGFAEWAYKSGYVYEKDKPAAKKISIDRFDSAGDYCPENCRWITVHENIERMLEERYAKNKCPA